AEKLLADAGFTGDAAAEAERLGAMLYLRRLGKEFGEEDAARRRLAEKPSDARPLYELGCVLGAWGHYGEALEKLLAAGERDPALAAGKVREAMVKVFQVIGVRSALADDYRGRLSQLLY